MTFYVDPRFKAHFRNLQQVFIYINDQCNLACDQCIYKPQVTYNNDREITTKTALDLLQVMRSLGAHKVTILGGEPTLYGRNSSNSLLAVIVGAREMGYSYIRVDTNGLFPPSGYKSLGLDKVDEIAFSLDGYDAETNDRLRGPGTFVKVTKQIRRAVALGRNCSITCCLQKSLYESDDSGRIGVERVIRLGESLGVSTVNFHDLFKAGVPMDTWTGAHNPKPEQHIEMYRVLAPRVASGAYSVKVRLPQGFVRREEFAQNRAYFGYCPVKLGERVMIHSEGTIRVCSNLICSSFGTARFNSDTIMWNDTASNEMDRHELGVSTPCTNRSKNMTYGEYVPLCFSFKPHQDEPSWNSLDWDARDQPIAASASQH